MMHKRYFSVEVCGNGFHIPTDDGRKTDGFVVMCFVEATDETDACDLALRSIVESATFHDSIGRHADPETAEVYAAQWAELDDLEGYPQPHGGFVFYGESGGLHEGWPKDHIGRDG